jgi:hypothetical protein
MHVTTPSAFASTQLARLDNRSGRRRQSGGPQSTQVTGSAHSMIEPAAELWLIGFYGPCFTDLIDFVCPTALHGGPRQHTRQRSQQAGSAINADRGKEVPHSTTLSLPARRKSMISFMPSGRSPKAPRTDRRGAGLAGEYHAVEHQPLVPVRGRPAMTGRHRARPASWRPGSPLPSSAGP